MANAQMTKVQMWNRYKALKKKDYNWTCICPVCSKQIYEKDPDIEYVKTKRGLRFLYIRNVSKNGTSRWLMDAL